MANFITTPQNIQIEYRPATLVDRGVAYVIDLFVMFSYYFSIITLIGFLQGAGRLGGEIFSVFMILFSLPLFFYSLILEYFMGGATLGKRALRIQVMDFTGGKATFGQLFIRWVFRILDIYLIIGLPIVAVASIATTERNQRLGDLVAGTLVVSTSRRTQLSRTAYRKPLKDYVPRYPQALQLSESMVRLISDCLIREYWKTNPSLVERMASMIEDELNITRGEKADQFLKYLLTDYNVLVGREQSSK